MKRYSIMNCEVEADLEQTKRWYDQAEEWGCECGECINFVAVAKSGRMPKEVLNYLNLFKIPPEKATYVCCLCDVPEGKLYLFSYRVTGTLLYAPKTEVMNLVQCCHEDYPYGAPGFPEPHFDLQFNVELPWIVYESLR